MKLENQVVSLELSKKLKGLGVKQESCFYWNLRSYFNHKEKAYVSHHPPYVSDESEEEYNRLGSRNTPIASAFTAAELGEMLPGMFEDKHYKDNRIVWILNLEKMDDGTWYLCYEPYTSNKRVHMAAIESLEKSEADCRAKMLIHLIEKGLVKL